MRLLISIFFLLISVSSIVAQDRNDFQTWYGSSLTLNLKKKWELSAQYRLRLIDNATTYRGSYLFLQANKRFNKYFSIFSNYRLALVNNGTFHRVALGAEARLKFNKFLTEFRPMFQYQNQQFNNDDEQRIGVSSYLRSRFRVKYDLGKKWDFYMYAEPFISLQDAKIDWWQNSIGLKYTINKRVKVNPYYIWQPDFSHKNVRTNHIIGIDLEFELKP